jgi:ABC-type transporter Mla MlaB component
MSGGSATLYLSGVLSASDAFPMRRVCVEIPERVRTLRLDLHAVTSLEEGAMDAVRAVVRYWRETRKGSFRLSFATEHIIATICEGDELPAPVQPIDTPLPHLGGRTAALMGTYL